MDDRIASMSRRAALGGLGAASAALLAAGPADAQEPRAPRLPPDSGTNVRTLGAMGDGKTDDSKAFQKALAAGGTVVVPPGTYRITEPLAVLAPVHIVGLGGEAFSIISFEGISGNALTITQGTGQEAYPGPPVEISGLSLYYDGAGAAIFISEEDVSSPFQNTRIIACRFYVTGGGTGLSSLNQRSLVVSHCQFLGSGTGTGIAINDSDNTTIVQNVFYHLTYGVHGIRGAVRVYNAGCVVIGNSLSGFEKCLYFENWESVQIVGNMLDGATSGCAHLVDCYRGSLSGNYLGPSGSDPAFLVETSQPRGGLGQLMFQGNYINHYGGNDGAAPISVVGVSPTVPVDQITIIGNIINEYPAAGAIHLKNTQNALITQNTLNRADATATGVVSIVDDTPGANHILQNIVDAPVVADGDTVTDNFTRVPAPAS